MTGILKWFLLFCKKMKVIIWSIHTFWYKGLANKDEKKEKWQVRKKGLYSETIIVRTAKRFFTKGSKKQWIWHFYNVFRSAKPNPTHYTKFDKDKENKIESGPKLVFRVFFVIFCGMTRLTTRALKNETPGARHDMWPEARDTRIKDLHIYCTLHI